jgi:HPt (histidine-containing phosphotransfer) domain-containing protein
MSVSPSSYSPQHDARYRELVTRYVDSFPEKLATLERAMAAGKQGSVEALREAREVAHRMHGTAGCYGLRELSQAAGVLDDVLTQMKRGEGGTWGEADAAATMVRAVAEAAVRDRK